VARFVGHLIAFSHLLDLTNQTICSIWDIVID